MAKLNHKSAVDRPGALSPLLSSALYFSVGTVRQALGGTRLQPGHAGVVGPRRLVISPWCWPVSLGCAKPNREEKSVSNGQRGGSVLWLRVPHPPSSPKTRGKERWGLPCWLETPLYGRTGREGKKKWAFFHLGWRDTLQNWFSSHFGFMLLVSVEEILIPVGINGGLGPWCMECSWPEGLVSASGDVPCVCGGVLLGSGTGGPARPGLGHTGSEWATICSGAHPRPLGWAY